MDFCVVAISGKAQSGKSSSHELIKNIINEKYPDYKIIRKPFAEKLKQIAEDLFGWDGDKNIYYKQTTIHSFDSFDEIHQEVIKDEGRPLLINIGQAMRNIRDTVWADYVKKNILNDIKNNEAHKKIYIIDDIRFRNEVNILKAFGSKSLIIRLERESQLDIDDISEHDLDNFNDWDFYIKNNGSMDELARQLNGVVDSIIERSKRNAHCE